MATLNFNLVAGTQFYLSDGAGIPSEGPQVGYFVDSPNPLPTLPLATLWQDYQGFFVFVDTALTDAAQFAGVLANYIQTAGLTGTGFLWIANPNDIDNPLSVIYLPVQSDQTTGGPTSFNLRNNILVVGQGSAITLDSTNNQFLFAQTAGNIYFQVDWGNTTLTGALGSTAVLPLMPGNSGCWRFQLTLLAGYLDTGYLDVALRYFLDDPSNPRPGYLASQRYPLLNPGSNSVVVCANFDPLDAGSLTRSYFSFTEQPAGGSGTAAAVNSFFRTNTGLEVQLTPQADARLVFAANSSTQQADPGDPLYLVPSGDFVMTPAGGMGVTGAASAASNGAHGPRLICGLGGNEYFDVLSNAGPNIISFTPGQNAYMPNFPPQSPGSTGATPSASATVDPLQPSATTSWATVKPGGDASLNYYAQPQNAELFANGFPSGSVNGSSAAAGSDTNSALGYLEVPAVGFTQSSLPSLVPLVPYAGVQSDTVPLSTVSLLETTVLSPYRRAQLGYAGPSAAAAKSANGNGTPAAPNSTTPQGLLASVAGPSMTSLVLGQSDTGVQQLLVNVASTNGLQGALQTNRQFIVITDLNVIQYFQSQISIGGWTFDFSAQTAGKQPAGEFYNVLILKYYNATIADLAANTNTWSNATTFNSSPADVSTWLQGYIADAQTQLTDGNAMFASFVDLVNNPSWNGILGLNVVIPPGTLPTEVQGLLGGIDLSKFSAHHFGVETNTVGPNFSLTQSSLFALINYDNTGGGAAAADDSSSDYAFKVLTLQVAFANSEIVDFKSRIQVTINNLFDVPATLSGGGGSANVVVLDGSYESHNGASTYSFVASGSFVFKLDSDLIDTVTFTKVQFTTVTSSLSGGSGTVTSTFGFWGGIKFGTLADFDFFSFDDLQFADLSLSFTFNPANVGSDKIPLQSFTFDPGNIRFDVSISRSRQDSLLGSFPLRLQGFTYDSAGVTVEDMGYLQIKSPITQLSGPMIYALSFELDLGTVGALASPLKGFAADFIAGWNPSVPGQVALGIKMPESSGGKLQIGIEGVLLLTIQNFEFTTLEANPPIPQRYVLYMRNCTLDVLGTTVPPGGSFSFVFFAPTGESFSTAITNLGWFVSFTGNEGNEGGGNGGNGQKQLASGAKAGDEPNNDPIFSLAYLALGQRVQVPGGVGDANTVSEVLEAIAGGITPDLSGDDLNKQLAEIYNPNQSWIVGGKFTILGTITLGAVFYDPNPYGMLIGIASGKLGPLGGFNFEILYKKVTDTIGVYKIQLTLPDALRQLQFGSVSITIPVIGIDIYTNGNFKIDVGFPNGTDFSNSLTVQVLPFLGAGGFYYAQLSQGTATNVPTPATGEFNPVLEFGFGLSLGVGKTINQGILSAGISVTFVGILEGTVAYWVPPNQSSGGAAVLFNKAPDYYEISGQIAIVGTLYGVVDFGIVKASLTVTISAGATLVWKAYDSLVLGVYAKVTVKLTVVIGGFKIFGIKIEIKISFSFSAEVSYSWTIPDNRTPPWETGLPAAASLALAAATPPQPLAWNAMKINSSPVPVTLFFSPQVTVAEISGGTQAQFVALLTMNTTATSGFSDFDNLASSLLAWAVSLYNGETAYNPALQVTATNLSDLSDLLSAVGTTVNDGPTPLNYSNISQFMAANFTATIADVPSTTDPSASQNTTIFPIIPDLVLAATGQAQNINYTQQGLVSSDYVADIAEYFAMLLVNYNTSEASGNTLAAAAANAQISMATVIYQDFFALVTKAAISQALTYMNTLAAGTAVELSSLLTTLQGQAGFVNVAGQASRFLLHGLQLPESFPADQSQWPGLTLQPLYQLAFQQIPLQPVSAAANVSAATSSSSFSATGLSATDGFYIGYVVTFTTGTLAQQTANVTGYVGATGTLTVSPAFTAAPAVGDAFLLSANVASSVNDAAATASSFIAAAGLSPADNAYVTYQISFTSGALNGQFRTISGYTGATLQITVSSPFTAAPANGDQFVIVPFAANLSIDTTPTSPWYQLSSTNPPSTAMAANALAMVETLTATQFAPTVTVQQCANLIQQPANYALQRNIPWQLVAGSTVQSSWTVWPFPSTLMNQLANTAQPLPQLTLLAQGNAPGAPPIVPGGLTYQWATTVNLTLQQIPSSGGFLSNTYQAGGTDETGRDLIFDLLNPPAGSNPQITGIYLLYNPQSQSQGGLLADANLNNAATVLMKVNLSTESAPATGPTLELALALTAQPPADAYNAAINQYTGFLQLVWELSIVNAGGYYLYYLNGNQPPNGLPSYVFNSGPNTQVTLLIMFAAGAPVATYNNCVVVTDPGPSGIPAQGYYAQASNLQAWHPTIAAGSVGFGVSVAEPTAGGALSDTEVELLTLFNLLTYRITNNGTFNTSIQGLPVGPTEPDGSSGCAAVANAWNYQQGIAVYPWFNTGGGAQNQSPYAGIGGNVAIDFALVDLFGNPMPNAQLPPLKADYLYFDDLIPLSAWPGVQTGYLTTTQSGASVVEITLSFQGSVFLDTTSSTVSDSAPTSSSFKGSGLATTDGSYVGGTLQFTSGALAGQTSTVTGFTGATGEITVSPAFSAAPANGAAFNIAVWNTSRATQSLQSLQLIGYQLTGPGVSISLTTTLAPGVTTPVQASQFTGSSGFITGIIAFLNAILAGTQNPTAPPPLVFSLPVPFAGREANTANIFEVIVTLTVAREASLVDPNVNTIPAGGAPPLALVASSAIAPQIGNTESSAVTAGTAPTATVFNGASGLSAVDGFYIGGVVTFTGGLLTGQTSSVTAYTGATQQITVSPAFTAAPAAGDPFSITPKLTLLPFAQEFEAACPELRAASGLGSAGPQSVFAIRIGQIQAGSEGITVAINQGSATFFAPKPLSNTLLSRPDASHPDPVMVIPYQSGGPDQNPIAMTFAGVDLDVFARAFLQAIDQFLSPEMAVPARQMNSDYYLAVITAKEALAAEIALGVTRVLQTLGTVASSPTTTSFNAAAGLASTDGAYVGSQLLFTSGALAGQKRTITGYTATSGQITVGAAFSAAPAIGDAFEIDAGSDALLAAQEAFTQRLLVTLGSDYNVSTIAQYLAEVTTNGVEEPVPPNLYGQMAGQPTGTAGNTTPDYGLSSAKIALTPGSSLLTFLFDSNVNEQAAVPLALQYQVSHVEHDISDSSQLGGFTSSSWLTLITNDAAAWPAGNSMTVGDTSIPVPLRAYPTPPLLSQQSALAGASEVSAPGVTLASQRLWHYECEYQQNYIPQDTVEANILFNVPPSGNNLALAAVGQDLFYWLARFSYEYSLMQADLATVATAPPGDKVATYAMQRFAELVWGAAYGTDLTFPLPDPLPPAISGPWAIWVTGGASAALGAFAGVPSLSQYQYSYQIEEVDATGSDGQIQLTADNSTYPYPDIKVQLAAATVAGSSPTSSSFTGSAVLPQTDGAFLGSTLTFETGMLAGLSSKISAYVGATRQLTVQPAFAQAPAVGDSFLIDTLIAPVIESGIANYEYNNPDPSTTLIRTLVFNGLDVISTENAWGGIQLARNKVLVEGVPTNPQFVYQTPIVRFVNKVTPMLDSSQPVDISQIEPSNPVTTLEYFLCVMINAIFTAAAPLPGTVKGAADDTTRTVRVGCSYGYDIRGQAGEASGEPLIVSVPVLLYPPFSLDLTINVGQNCAAGPSPQSLAYQMGQQIRTWFSGYQPATAGGVFVFDITVFAGLSQTNLPVLRLRNLFLDYSSIQPPI